MTEASPPAPEPDAPQAASEVSEASEASEAELAGGGGYRVQLPTFEGPLDLLLHLIEEHELDIRDIPIAFIAEKYVEYITLMEELNIDTASEYLVMAATLTHIKSKMLLPTPPADQEEDEEDQLDPRAELVRRLLEYQKYKHAAEQLASSDVLGRDVFNRGLPAPQVDGPAPIAGLSLFKLLDAFQHVMARAKATVDHQIDIERFSITDRINELSEMLSRAQSLSFEELFVGQRTRIDLIVTFLALLEMTRLRLTRLTQTGPYEPIVVQLAVNEEDAAPTDPEATAGSEGELEPGAEADADGDADAETDDSDAETLRPDADTLRPEPDVDADPEPPEHDTPEDPDAGSGTE